MDKTICELFAGVGGFRLGFDKLESGWETVWFNQYEPSMSKQYAHDCYVAHFGDCKDSNGEYHTGEDINMVKKENIPNFNLLVYGFPCQNFSVAASTKSAKGIEGKKGVLWWQAYETIQAKRPAFIIFENVDRLLKSPSKQRGRDFGIILASLNNLGYNVEWRVINAAAYGCQQKRKRTFAFIYRNDTHYAKKQEKLTAEDIIKEKGFFATTFPIEEYGKITEIELETDLIKMTESFAFNFENAGYMCNGKAYTSKIVEKDEGFVPLGDILEENVDEKYFITDNVKLEKWKYLKGGKKIPRTTPEGFEYIYSEGPVAFPDYLDRPARTMLTSEGTINRSSHIIKDPQNNRFRILTPIEAERIQGFDDNWTDTGMTERMRYFCMGNALVVPLITRMGKTLDKIFIEE